MSLARQPFAELSAVFFLNSGVKSQVQRFRFDAEKVEVEQGVNVGSQE